MTDFDPGYVSEPFVTLCRNYPDESAYPKKDFRVEGGPIFHRGRLDGTSRVLIVGQDPAQHETVLRRILVGEAGTRLQGLLAKLGIDTSYTLINTFLYSVYGTATKYVDDAPILAYRNGWIQAIIDTQKIEAVVCLGDLAGQSWDLWIKSGGKSVPQIKIWHPTRRPRAHRGANPQESSRSRRSSKLEWRASRNQARDSAPRPASRVRAVRRRRRAR